jgi:methionyl-tRNA formyltransferase
MNVAAIGRTQMLYDAILALTEAGHTVTAIITAPASPEYTRTEQDFVELGDRLDVPVFVTTRLDSPEIVAALARTDLGISINWVSILKQKHLDIFKHGILNAHAGDIPKYRGNACPNWALLAGEKEIVLTVHRMVPDALDCGDIVVQERFPLTGESTIGDIYTWMEKQMPAAFVSAVEKMSADPTFKTRTADQADSNGFRCYPRVPEDGFVDWNCSVESIDALVRASSAPFSGAYCFMRYDNEIRKLVILKAHPVESHPADKAIPGQILKNDRDTGETHVQCGSGVLALSLCRFAGDEGEFRPGDHWRSIRMRLSVRPEDWLWEIYKHNQVKHIDLTELVPVGQR